MPRNESLESSTGAASITDVDVASSALPNGAATSANQTTEITALEKIDDLQGALNDVGIDELRVLLHDGTNGADIVSHEDEISLRVVGGRQTVFNIHVNAENIQADTGFMLIDLSDTVNWPHTNTDHIALFQISVNINPDTSFAGDIDIGFLTSVDDENGDFNQIFAYHLDRQAAEIVEQLVFPNGLDLEDAEHFGPITANDTTWQTDVNLLGPSGAASFPAGNGDFVMKINRTSGAVDVSILATYITVPA